MFYFLLVFQREYVWMLNVYILFIKIFFFTTDILYINTMHLQVLFRF